jgi:hypothetical protein
MYIRGKQISTMWTDHEIEENFRMCDDCKHYQGSDKCPAFDKIPFQVFYDAEQQHRKPLPGQAGDHVFETDKPAPVRRVYMPGE